MIFMNEEGIKKHYERKAAKQICKDNAKTEYKQKVLENRKKLIPNMLEIKQLKAQLKEPAIRKRISNILLLLAIVMTGITTMTTIAGGLNYRNTILTMVTYIAFVAFAQLTILVISCLKPYLYNKAPNYISITSMLQIFLLIVSISFNFIFLHNSDNSGYIVFLNSEVKQIEKPVYDSVDSTVINDIKKIILKHKVNNIAPSTKKILSLTDFKQHEVIAAKKQLIETGYLKVVGNTTYINNLEVVG